MWPWDQGNGLALIHSENSPEVLAKKSREIISSLGYPGQPLTGPRFSYDYDFLIFSAEHSPIPNGSRAF